MAERAYKYDFGYDANAAVQPKRKVEVQKQPELKVIVNPLAKEIATRTPVKEPGPTQTQIFPTSFTDIPASFKTFSTTKRSSSLCLF